MCTGTESRRITVGTSSTSPPCVWALLVLPDGTVVSADQEGAVQFWDGAFGTLLARHQQHAADVLALAASQDGGSVWASGVDPKVAAMSAGAAAGAAAACAPLLLLRVPLCCIAVPDSTRLLPVCC